MLRWISRTFRSELNAWMFVNFSLAKRPRLYFGTWFFSMIATAALTLFAPRNWSMLNSFSPAILLLIALLPTALRIVGSLIDLRSGSNLFYRLDEDFAKKILKSEPSEAEVSSGFIRAENSSKFQGSVVFSPELNSALLTSSQFNPVLQLCEHSVRFENILSSLRHERHAVSDHIRRLTAEQRFTMQPFVDENKVGLASTLTRNSDTISIYKTSYYLSACTAELSRHRLIAQEAGNRRPITQARDRAPFNFNGATPHLLPFEQTSPAVSLHIGVTMLAVSSDGILRVPYQLGHNRVDKESRTPFVAGSADWKDTKGKGRLKDLIVHSALRELREEWCLPCFLKHEEICRAVSIVGYFRLPNRAGKPEFAVFAKLALTDSELRANTSEHTKYRERETHRKLDSASEFSRVHSLDRLKNIVHNILNARRANKDSASLLGVTICLGDAIERHPEEISALLKS